jgi:hypothetical protein
MLYGRFSGLIIYLCFVFDDNLDDVSAVMKGASPKHQTHLISSSKKVTKEI